MKNLGSKIRFERKKKQMTLAQLAKKVGTSPMTLHRIEAGKTSPSITLLSEIERLVFISIEKLSSSNLFLPIKTIVLSTSP